MSDRTIKQKLKYYLSLNYPMIITKDEEEKVYFVEFPDLPGCMAHGETPTSAVTLAQKVKKEWIETALSLEFAIPEPKKEEDYSGRFSLRLSKTLHKQLTGQAKREGKSLNQHILFLLSEQSRVLDLANPLDRFEHLINKLEKNVDQQEKYIFITETKAEGSATTKEKKVPFSVGFLNSTTTIQ
jgi:predicted RNase H-like HicB family nuclease